MYIKQVIIKGFRSYRDQTDVEPFSPGHNVIVGRNGSGKSNFFHGIQFVLSDEYSNLRPERKQALLHEGSGPKVMQAFVEIIFDNSDGRLPVDKTEVSLRRSVGGKKDQYFLDGKVINKQEVISLLESAGFSKSNPYYIVKQGKIHELAVSPDSYRLKLLREVAGTRVYDERREESSAIMKETANKVERIIEFLKYIEDRLKTLEEEKEDLKEYQKLDRIRRSLEYTIFDHELQDKRRKLDELSQKRENYNEECNKYHETLQEITDQIFAIQKQLRELERKWNSLEEERVQLNNEQTDIFQHKTKLELTIKDLKEEVEGERSSRRRAEEDVKVLKNLIAEKQDRLKVVTPRFSQLVSKEQETRTELLIAEQKRKELYSKQGWTQQFQSVEERDTWIKRNMSKLHRQITEKREQISRLEHELREEEKRLATVEDKLTDSIQELEQQRESIEKTKRYQSEIKQERDALQNERQEVWRKETSLTHSMQACKDEISQREIALRSLIGKAIMHGMDSVQKVIESFRTQAIHTNVVEGYYGTMIENFKADKKFFTAVEVTAGSRLFFHIVSTDRVGTKILEEINRLKLPGEANFLPLNRLETRNVQYPKNADAIPLINQLQYDEKFYPVMKHCFGKTLICRNIEVATMIARAEQLDCITLDGDQVSHKGTLSGGYYDSRRSRLELQVQKTELYEQLAKLEAEFASERETLTEIEAKINSVVSEMQRLETKSGKMRDVYDKLQQDGKLLREERQVLKNSKEPKERQQANLQSTLQQLEAQMERLNQNLGSRLLSQLTDEEQRIMDELNEKIDSLLKAEKDLFNERTELEAEKNSLENELNNNLLRKREELQSKLLEITIDDKRHSLESYQTELAADNEHIQDINRRLSELEEQLEEYYRTKKDLNSQLENWQTNERQMQQKINDIAKEMEKLANTQSIMLKKKEECMKKIVDVGTLPTDAFEKWQNLTTKQLFKKLTSCNTELKKYENVNKKALDQFLCFSEQKEKLQKRKEELDRGYQAILDMLHVMEQRKCDAILLTFKQVSKYFEDVFHELVPGGNASLIMKTSANEEPGLPGYGMASRIDQFTGVGIKVTFSGTDETKEMQQLSGGQKSLVALALIFAIQKCDPAPFYLFDEIDAALDSQHRKAVADMIHKLSKNAQFITTTFRKELLEKADKFYGVRFRNKVSHIDCVTAAEAADFVEDDATHV